MAGLEATAHGLFPMASTDTVAALPRPQRRRLRVSSRSPTTPLSCTALRQRSPHWHHTLRSDLHGKPLGGDPPASRRVGRYHSVAAACLNAPGCPFRGWSRVHQPRGLVRRGALGPLTRGGWRPALGSSGLTWGAGRGSRAVTAHAGGRDFESRRRRGWGGDDSEEDMSAELQKLLVEQVRLQIGEVQVQQVVDESQQHLREAVRQDMGEELDRIALRAMRGADEFSNRVLKQLDASAQAIERDLNLARKEMEAREREFEKFQKKVHQSSNEGMFFKSISTPYSPSARARGRQRRTRITRIGPPTSGSAGRSGTVLPPAAVAGAVGPSAAPSFDEGDAAEQIFKKVLYLGLSLTCVSFLWSFASALLDGHWMSSSKVVEYAAVFAGFTVIKAGFEASAEEERQYAAKRGAEQSSGEAE